MIFSELYSAYYNAVAAVLTEAVSGPVDYDRVRAIAEKYAFGESFVSIPSALKEEKWQLLKPDRTSVTENIPSMPMTALQKRWVKAILSDPRIRLFGDFDPDLSDVEPLFTSDDYLVFDRYLDGDDYSDEDYIRNFRLILDAIKNKYPLELDAENRSGSIITRVVFPEYLEYSEKDDKFRLIASGNRLGNTINLSRIIRCEPYKKPIDGLCESKHQARPRSVIFELSDRRSALERVLLHFAHFQKEAEKIGDDRYKVTVHYDKDDETEVLIRILSFGPMVKVTAPTHFVELVKERLKNQKSCEH
ncbi:MAG: WYL domain-containing protein [Blautia sp.]|nr:WYL domain-containing protein [Blautia sp.]